MEKLNKRDHKDFLYSASKGDTGQVQRWIEKGVQLDFQNSAGETALFLAASSNLPGHLETIKALLRAGANPLTRTTSRQTVTHNLASSGCIEGMKVMIMLNLPIEHEGWEAATELLLAAKNKQKEMCEFLLTNGANANARDMKGTNVIYACARNNDVELMKVFVGHSVKLDAKSFEDEASEGETPLHCAVRKSNREAAQFLLEKGAKLGCKGCKKGKSCAKIKDADYQWYTEMLQSQLKLKKSSSSMNLPKISLSTPTMSMRHKNSPKSQGSPQGGDTPKTPGSPRQSILSKIFSSPMRTPKQSVD